MGSLDNSQNPSNNQQFFIDNMSHHLGSTSRIPSISNGIASFNSRRSYAVFSHRETHLKQLKAMKETSRLIMQNLKDDENDQEHEEENFLFQKMKTKKFESPEPVIHEHTDHEDSTHSYIDPDIYNKSFD